MSSTHVARSLIPSRPASRATDPFLVLAEDWFPQGVFDVHPHRGFETVTYVLEGSLDHFDSKGNSGRINAGEMQWMTAGRGIEHNEIPAEGSVVHSLQLWINLSAKDKSRSPRYQDLTASNVPVRVFPGGRIHVYSGVSGDIIGPAKNYTPVTLLRIDLDPGSVFTENIPASYNAFVVILEGDGSAGANDISLPTGSVGFLDRPSGNQGETSSIDFTAGKDGMVAMLFSGEPIGEPVAQYGPFVMNTETEIREALSEYAATQFRD
ncbi:pirin family protein [Mycobacteroides chelonae]|nr:pirin family protein [Mycobacteroides chelonae]